MVEYLDIFGKKYPVRIGYYVMKKVKEETGKSFSGALEEIEETGDIELHETILFYALKMGAFAEKEELDLERDQMEMVLDACFYDYLKLFQSEKFFPPEMKELAEEGNNPGNVKKTPKKKKKK